MLLPKPALGDAATKEALKNLKEMPYQTYLFIAWRLLPEFDKIQNLNAAYKYAYNLKISSWSQEEHVFKMLRTTSNAEHQT